MVRLTIPTLPVTDPSPISPSFEGPFKIFSEPF